MSKKILLKTLLTTSTVGLLGGGIAASLVGCSPKSQNNSGTKVLTINASNTIGTVGTALPIAVTYSGFNYDVTGHRFELHGSDARYFLFGAENGSGTLNVTLNINATEARAYNLQIKDTSDNTVAPSNTVPITLNAPVVGNLTIEVTSSSTGEVGTELDVAGTWKTNNFDVTEASEIHPSSNSDFSNFSAYENGTFTAKLDASKLAGEHPLQIQYGEIFSNIINITLNDPAQKALQINVSTPTITANGIELDIEGTYEAINIDSPNITIESDIYQFNNFDVDYANKTFTATLTSDVLSGDYDLQLVATDGDDGNIYSNKIRFTVGPIAASNGSNWSGRTSGIVEMSLNNDNMTATISRNYNYVADDLVIPEYVFENGKFYKVTSIGAGAFGNCSGLTGSLSIPNSVINIGWGAFSNCEWLTGSLTISNSVTSIGKGAFGNCSGLTGSLSIPNSVWFIGDGAFENCSGLTGSLIIPDSVRSIGSSAFASCGFTGSLTIPNSVRIIGDGAFENCSGLTGSLTIPDSVTSIGDFAFNSCRGLTGSLTIPNSVISIAQFAFFGCSGLTNITLDGFDSEPSWQGANIFSNWNDGGGTVSVDGDWPIVEALVYLKGKGLPESWTAQALTIAVSTATFDNEGNQTITGTFTTEGIDDPDIQLTGDDKAIFSNFSIDGNTFSVTISNTITAGDYSLQLIASGVKSNIIPCTVYGNDTGTNWSGRTDGSVEMDLNDENMTATIVSNDGYVANDLVIPEYVIKNDEFYEVVSIGEGAFRGCSGLTGSLTIPNSVKSIGGGAFENCSGLTGSLTIGSGVESIGGDAFWNCSGLTGNLTIPNKVKSIGGGAFDYCSGLTGSLTIGNSVESIGNYAFDSCSGLTGSLSIPNGVKSIGLWAFSNCSGLTGSLTIPDSVTSIGSVAFYHCSGLTGSLTIPSSVVSIGNSVFDGCIISSIILSGFDEPPSWGEPRDIFYSWVDHGTVVSDGTYSSVMALDYLITLGLPDSWTAA